MDFEIFEPVVEVSADPCRPYCAPLSPGPGPY